MTGNTAEPTKYRSIDALRGWAILLVVLTHAAQGQFAIDALRQAVPRGNVLVLPDWLHLICAAAGSGVHLFFVVSALSLSLSWAARGETGWQAYLIRRFCRIAPMFYAGVALYLVLYGNGPRFYAQNGIGPGDVALTLGFLHIWSTNAINSVMPGDWSIGVEAMFYLILPLLLALGRTAPRLAGLTIGFAALAQIIRWTDPGFGPFGNPGFPSQAVVFLFGLCAARAIASGPASTHSPRLGGASLALFLFLVAGLPLVHLPETMLAYQIQFGAGAGLLCVLLHRSPIPILVNEALIRLGRISFSVYVLHFALFAPIFAIACQLVPGADDGVILAVYYPLLLVAAIACASITHAVIERPGIRLGRLLIARLDRRLAVPAQ